MARSSFAPTTHRPCASSIYNQPRTSTFLDRRRIFALLPTPFAAILQLIARTPPHCRARIRPLARYFYSSRTAFPTVIPRSCPFCAQLRHASRPSTRKRKRVTSKPVNERNTRSNHLTCLLAYAFPSTRIRTFSSTPSRLLAKKEIGAPLREKCADCSGGLKRKRASLRRSTRGSGPKRA